MKDIRRCTVLMTVTNAFTNDPRVRKEADALSRHGYRIVVCAMDRGKSCCATEYIGSVLVKRMSVNAPYGDRLRGLFAIPVFLLFCLLHGLVLRPQVVHVHDFDTAAVGVVMKLLLKTTLVYDAHDHYPSMIRPMLPSPMCYLINLLDRAFAATADCLVVPSAHRARLYSARRIMNVPNLPSRREAPSFMPRRSSVFTIYYGGGLAIETATLKLMHLASTMTNIRVVLAGDGRLRSYVERVSHSNPRLVYLGHVSRAMSLSALCAADVTVVMYEPCTLNNLFPASNKLFEAMMLGIPIITNAENSMAEIVKTEKCGVLIPYYDDAALDEAVRKLRSSERLRKALGSNGRKASSRYSWESFEPDFVSRYDGLVDERL